MRAAELLRHGAPMSRVTAELNLEIYRRCMQEYDRARSNRDAQAESLALLTPETLLAELGDTGFEPDVVERWVRERIANRHEWVQREQHLTDMEAAYGPTSQEAVEATADLADFHFTTYAYAPADYHLKRLVDGPLEGTAAQRGRATGQLAVIRSEQGRHQEARRLLARIEELGPEAVAAAMEVPDLLQLVERERSANAVAGAE